MTSLSVVIIANHEEATIGQCIDSARSVSDDIVVVDSGSSDQTMAIAKEKGARVFQREFDGYGANKNYGNDQAVNDWILSLDADEVMSKSLIQSVLELNYEPHHIYTINSLAYIGNQPIYHSGWFPKFKNRIFNKNEVKWSSALVHEDLEPLDNKKRVALNGILHHFSYKNWDELIHKSHFYANLKADQWKITGKSPTTIVPYLAFVKSYILKRGFLDGKAGWRIALNDLRLYKIALKALRQMNG